MELETVSENRFRFGVENVEGDGLAKRIMKRLTKRFFKLFTDLCSSLLNTAIVCVLDVIIRIEVEYLEAFSAAST